MSRFWVMDMDSWIRGFDDFFKKKSGKKTEEDARLMIDA